MKITRPCEMKAEVTKTSGFSLFGERMSSGLLSNGVVVGSPPRIGSHVCKFESFAFIFLINLTNNYSHYFER